MSVDELRIDGFPTLRDDEIAAATRLIARQPQADLIMAMLGLTPTADARGKREQGTSRFSKPPVCATHQREKVWRGGSWRCRSCQAAQARARTAAKREAK